jgi:hypothetical protein
MLVAFVMIIPWNGVVQQKSTGLPERYLLLRTSTGRFRPGMLPQPLADNGLRRTKMRLRGVSTDRANEQRNAEAPPLAKREGCGD